MDDFNSGYAMECFKQICSELSTPLAYKASCLLKDNNLKGVLELKVNPAKYSCAQTLLSDLQVVSFFKKYEDLPFSDSKSRVEAAEKLFWQSEHACFATNRRLDPLFSDSHHYGARIGSFLETLRKKVRTILGRAPVWELVEGRFGSGSTFGNIGSLTTVADKLTDYYTVTQIPKELVSDWNESAWSRYAALGSSSPDGALDDQSAYAVRSLSITRGNRFTTVPKQWDKDRGICIEPSVNVFYQLGIGSFISKRLKRNGIDKKTGQVAHKALARIGSLTGAVSTIDLSNASDTMSEALIELLLPDDWLQLVTAVRCTHTLFNGRWVKLEKFSSMGNGFTFELETLVFYAIALTVAELEGIQEDPYTPGLTISVYGDDIIVPTSITASVVSSLRFFGFQINEDKTFVEGHFRESCGGDYLHGYDVRPFYLKENLNENHRYIAAANGLFRTRLRGASVGLKQDWLIKPWRILVRALPTSIRRNCIGPAVLGDLVLHDVSWEKQAKMRVRHSIRYLRVWRPVMHKPISLSHFRPGVLYAATLYGDSQTNKLEIGLIGKPVSPFIPKKFGSYISGYKLGWVPYS